MPMPAYNPLCPEWLVEFCDVCVGSVGWNTWLACQAGMCMCPQMGKPGLRKLHHHTLSPM